MFSCIKLLLSLLIASSLSAQVQIEEETGPQPADSATRAIIIQENLKSQVQGNNTFALELYQRLRNERKNIIISPFSLTSAFVLAYAGAAGATQNEIQAVMHYLSNTENLYDVFEVLNKKLSTPWFQGPNESRLMLANALWVQLDYKILPNYLDLLNRAFKSTLRMTDFMRNPEASRLNINAWVKERTQGRISDLIAAGEIDNSNRLLLVSAIFMKAVWKNAFDTTLTKSGVFFLDNINSSSAAMMTTSAHFPYFETKTFQALEMPYRSSYKDEPQFSMILLLPKNSYDPRGVEDALTIENYDTILSSFTTRQVIATVPKFDFADGYTLETLLQQMGMGLAFSRYADFSGISDNQDLSLNKVLHKAFISVDEKGTEAIAATAISIGLKSAAPDTSAVIFKADHPFVFMIVDRSTNSLLFIGRLLTP